MPNEHHRIVHMDSSTAGKHVELYLHQTANPNGVVFKVTNGASVVTVQSSNPWSENKWQLVGAACGGDTNHSVYNGDMLDEASDAFVTDNTTNVPTVTTRGSTYVSARGGTSNFFDGLLAWVCIWDGGGAMSINEFRGMLRGIHPPRFHYSNGKAFWPMRGLESPEPDISGTGLNLTLNNGPTRDVDPPMMWYPGGMTVRQPRRFVCSDDFFDRR